jgi:hypothetical protein
MKSRFPKRGALAVTATAVLGAIGGIAGSAASSRHASASHTTRGTFTGRPPMRGPGGRAVHEEAVVLNKAGTAFITATSDDGTVKSVSGGDVTITEAIGSVTYKDVTITIPDGATIRRNGATAILSDLKAGDRIDVTQSSDGTTVFAADSSYRPFRDHGGPGDAY